MAITTFNSLVIRIITVKASSTNCAYYPKEPNEKRADYNKSLQLQELSRPGALPRASYALDKFANSTITLSLLAKARYKMN